jgi:hypothetical protein
MSEDTAMHGDGFVELSALACLLLTLLLAGALLT